MTKVTIKRSKPQIEYLPPINMPDVENLEETKGFDKRFPKVKDAVKSIVKNDKYARENKLWLCLRFWAKKSQIKIIIPKEKFNQVNSPESITRALRKLYEEAEEGEPSLQFLIKDKNLMNNRANREIEVNEYFKKEKRRKMLR